MKFATGERETSLSWQEIAVEVRNLGRAFLARGLQTGDRVGVWSRIHPEAVLVELAAISLGAVSVAVDPDLPFESALQQLQRSGVRYLFLEGKETIERTMT